MIKIIKSVMNHVPVHNTTIPLFLVVIIALSSVPDAVFLTVSLTLLAPDLAIQLTISVEYATRAAKMESIMIQIKEFV